MSTHYMDEAERCTRLAYLAYAELVITGTVPEVIAATHLNTWSIKGKVTTQLLQRVKNFESATQVALFGNQIHVCGIDTLNIEKELKRLTQDYEITWEAVPPTLEDAFINLVEKSEGALG